MFLLTVTSHICSYFILNFLAMSLLWHSLSFVSQKGFFPETNGINFSKSTILCGEPNTHTTKCSQNQQHWRIRPEKTNSFDFRRWSVKSGHVRQCNSSPLWPFTLVKTALFPRAWTSVNVNVKVRPYTEPFWP